jgi:hypothetical protein
MKQTYTPMKKEDIQAIKAGDVIERMLGFAIPCYLVVEEVTDTLIKACWEFDRNTGLEVDEDIPATVSYIRRVLNEDQKAIVKEGKNLPEPE